MSFLSRRPVGSEELNGRSVAGGGSWVLPYPALIEYLTASSWPDGQPRETATLLIFCEQSSWKVCLHDRSNSLKTWMTADDPATLLELLEAALATDKASWRKDRPPGRGRS
jgi:hypothetical protein